MSVIADKLTAGGLLLSLQAVKSTKFTNAG